ncbi:LacI family DNA-binding transcriptional regulator [Mariniluteicoccus endophyticus]
MRVTIKTIAEDLGVSPATVSNAYNKPDQLSAALRERILARASDLGYDGPSAAAQSLRSGHSGAVGLLLSHHLHYAFSDPFAVAFLAGMTEACEDSGMALLLLPSRSDREADLAALRRANIDGLSEICLMHNDDLRELARRREVPFVGTFANSATDYVAIDDEGAGRLLGTHLAALGHRRVAVVLDSGREPGAPIERLAHVGPEDARDAPLTPLDAMFHVRVRGVVESLPGAEVDVVQGGSNSLESGRAAADHLLAHGLPTAIVAISDVLALGVLARLEEAGVRVPEDVSVCGVDDIPDAETAGLTTVHQPIREKGFRVGQLLVDPDLQPRQVVLPIHLVERTTTGPAPA